MIIHSCEKLVGLHGELGELFATRVSGRETCPTCKESSDIAQLSIYSADSGWFHLCWCPCGGIFTVEFDDLGQEKVSLIGTIA